MIQIVIHYANQQSKQPELKSLLVKGHSWKTTNAIEPACACVSNIILGLVNYLQRMPNKQQPQMIVKSGYVNLSFATANWQLEAVNLTIIQLQMAAMYFKKQINLRTFK